jgi:hypothetical protein
MDDCNFGYHVQNSSEKQNTPRSSGLKDYFFGGVFFPLFFSLLVEEIRPI